MNSPANCARLGGAAKFEAIVKANPSFAALADRGCDFQCLDEGDSAASRCTVQVLVQMRHEQLEFAFDVSKAESVESGYATDGVRIIC